MIQDRPRAKFPPARWPVPPIRTLRGEVEPVAAPSRAWAAPVRSGLVRDELPVLGVPEVKVESAAGLFEELEIRTEPLPPLEPSLPLADWAAAEEGIVLEAEIVPDHEDAEIILNDEVFWIDDLEPVVDTDAPVEGLTPLGAVGAPVAHTPVPEVPLEGLTAIGDVDAPDTPLQATEAPVRGLTATGDTVTPPAADMPGDEVPVEGLTTIGDSGDPADGPVPSTPIEGLAPIGDVGIPVLDPPAVDREPDPWNVRASRWDESETEEPAAPAPTEWEALGQPLAESLAVPPTDFPATGESGETSDVPDSGESVPDPMELASRLERLADQIRMHGVAALEAAQADGDSLEAALARALAGLAKKDPG